MSWFSNAVHSVGAAFSDAAQIVAKAVVAPVNLVTGHEYKPDLQTGVGKAVNAATTYAENFAGDIAKTTSYLVTAPINSVTGHTYDVDFKTGVGKVLGDGAIIGINNVHTVGKSFADTITAGYASKAVNLIRKDENKESAYHYNEQRVIGDGLIGKFSQATTVASGVLGMVGGAVAAAAGIGKVVNGGANLANSLTDAKEGANVEQASFSAPGSVSMLPIVAIILLVFLTKK
jgi:hypothetical protein